MNGFLPVFDLAEGGLPLALVRGLSVSALFSVYGTLIFHSLVAWSVVEPVAEKQAARRRHLKLVRVGVVLQIAALLAWLLLQAAVFVEATSFDQGFDAIMPVLEETSFGHLIAGQIVLGAVALLALGRGGRPWRWYAAAIIATVAILLQAGHGHGYAMYAPPSWLLASDALHLLCAGAWLGGLLPMMALVREVPLKVAGTAARSFSRLGICCVVGLVLSAAFQAWTLVGGLSGLIGTAYGWMVAAKSVLLLGLLGFAAANRYRLTPALEGDEGSAGRRSLVRNIAWETGLGIVTILAASILSSLPPGLHTQPVWPFDLRPSLVTIAEDPSFRHEVAGAVLALGCAVAVLALGIAVRRLRWPALACAAIIAWFAVPHLGLLFVEAYPTSFYQSPNDFAAASITEGAALYAGTCASCHGDEGHGDGQLAKTLPVPPADLTAGHLWAHSDGELFWWLSHGIEAPEGGMAMPGFAGSLTEEERWSLIDFIRAHNAGLVYASSGAWAPPVKAPELAAACPQGRTVNMADLTGKVVRVVFEPSAAILPPLPAAGGVEIVTLVIPSRDQAARPPDGACIVSDPSVRAAYAIVSGLPPERLSGIQFLVDPNGWLRLSQRPGETVARGWDDPATLLATAVEICRHPIAAEGGGHAHHHGA